MTRKEQVTNKVKEIVHESGYNAIPSTLFEMATWADKTMIEKACSILEDMTEGRLGKRFISEFKNKLKYGVLERH